MSGCTGERDLFPADAPLPSDLSTRMTTEFFDYAQVGRCQLGRQGADVAACLTRFEQDALDAEVRGAAGVHQPGRGVE